MSDEKLKIKDYSTHSTRMLNRLVRLRTKQIDAAERGQSRTDKSLAQLKYELEAMTTALMERSMHDAQR